MRILLFIVLFWAVAFGTAQNFTIIDTLKSNAPLETIWWDANYYHLDIAVDPTNKFISGKNTIVYKVLQSNKVLQIALQAPLKITKVVQNKRLLKFTTKGNTHFIKLRKKQKIGAINEIVIHYSGQPKEALNPPWDGGFSWDETKEGKPFIATTSQGIGASVWWPNKEYLYDEIDSMLISVKSPNNLINVANGTLRKFDSLPNTYHWFVANPINNYGVTVNVAPYAHFSNSYSGELGNLNLNYYVLKSNIEKAKTQFLEVPKMLEAFEYWFGPYPFYEDGYKLVETPYIGMEHQSAIAYGNQFKQGYLGTDLSNSSWGLKFDFIIVHESAHEWFGNSITNKSVADMWIHESFASYAESLFLEYHFGKEAANDYVIGTRSLIKNDTPIIGTYETHKKGSSDMYFKGANMLHTIRQVIDDDNIWRDLLRGLNNEFYHKTTTTFAIENYISNSASIDFSAVFNQYLRTTQIPVLKYVIENEQVLKYRYENVVDNFSMPLKIYAADDVIKLKPTRKWQYIQLRKPVESIQLDRNFYVTLCHD